MISTRDVQNALILFGVVWLVGLGVFLWLLEAAR